MFSYSQLVYDILSFWVEDEIILITDLCESLLFVSCQMLNVDLSPNMNQYVGLLEVICSSCPSPNAEVLQDVSVIYALLGENTLTL